jgi:cell division protein FtsB
MKKINIHQLNYKLRYKYLTLNNVVVAVALLIGASWVWGAIGVMQRNYDLQKDVNYKQRELTLAQLQTANLKLENRYYQTREYQELAVRKGLGLIMPGESVLILPKNTAETQTTNTTSQVTIGNGDEDASNFQQWVDFLFGAKAS